jgi:hypothetical protein
MNEDHLDPDRHSPQLKTEVEESFASLEEHIEEAEQQWLSGSHIAALLEIELAKALLSKLTTLCLAEDKRAEEEAAMEAEFDSYDSAMEELDSELSNGGYDVG